MKFKPLKGPFGWTVASVLRGCYLERSKTSRPRLIHDWFGVCRTCLNEPRDFNVLRASLREFEGFLAHIRSFSIQITGAYDERS
jgi:hypothetical protein